MNKISTQSQNKNIQKIQSARDERDREIRPIYGGWSSQSLCPLFKARNTYSPYESTKIFYLTGREEPYKRLI